MARERGKVASVFVNRLNKNMRLQTDPTVIYGITKGAGVFGCGLRRSELRAKMPWYTYVILRCHLRQLPTLAAPACLLRPTLTKHPIV